MSRQARVARGAVGALAATLLAAASHGLAGGDLSAFAVIATTAVALPICVALAGRVGSLWRLALGVSAAQFLYHWAFAGIGLGMGTAEGASPAPLHAAHLNMVASFSADLGTAGSADAIMWIGHAIAAALTVALLHRGERAVIGLLRLVARAIPRRVPAPVAIVGPRPLKPLVFRSRLRVRIAALQAMSHRGPPAFAASTS